MNYQLRDHDAFMYIGSKMHNRGYVYSQQLALSFNYSKINNSAVFTSAYDFIYKIDMDQHAITAAYVNRIFSSVINAYVDYTHTQKYRDRVYYYSLVCGVCGDGMQDCYCKDCIDCITSEYKCAVCNLCDQCCYGYHSDDYEVNLWIDDNEVTQ
jgi:hypothetical protein